MTSEEFVSLVGAEVAHVTLTSNLPCIRAHGLLPPARLAELAKCNREKLELRTERLRLKVGAHGVQLNSQAALLAGLNHAATFLDGHSMESWSGQLDNRVFFWPGRGGTAFERSMQQGMVRLRFDSRRFFERLAGQIDLAPINTGSAKRKPARRGDWIYVSALESVDAFRRNRASRGVKSTPDKVEEISVRADIPTSMLSEMLLD